MSVSFKRRDNMAINGIHHISMIVHSPQKTVEFYRNFLKLNLIKQTVNFDDPYTYHLYFGNKDYPIGSLVTFFPWFGGRKGVVGDGQVYSIQFNIPKGSLAYWEERFNQYHIDYSKSKSDNRIFFKDPDDIAYELVESNQSISSKDIINFYGVKLYSKYPYKTKDVLINQLDFKIEDLTETSMVLSNNNYTLSIEYANKNSAYGVGTVHHMAFSLDNDLDLDNVMSKINHAKLNPTSIKDRLYFKSVYFKEPGGNLFEIATNEPGFTVDEHFEELGSSLKIPPMHEDKKTIILKRLDPLELRQCDDYKSK